MANDKMQMAPPGIANAWFGPGLSIPPVAPRGTTPRTWDYTTNTNLNYGARKDTLLNFEQLRMMADGCYLFRAIMEKVKKRIAAHKWEFRLKAKAGEHSASVQQRSYQDPRVRELTDMFQQPDGEHDWPEWVGGLLEDQIVIDAATLWVERDSKDRIVALPQIDGATINRIIDVQGRTPRPPYVAYQQRIKGMPAIDLTQEDVLYAVSNYRPHRFFGYSDVEQLSLLCLTQMNRAEWTLNHYTEGNIPEVFLMMDSEKYSAEQIKEFMVQFEAKNNGSLANRQRVFPLPDGNIKEMRGADLYDAFDEWQARVFCYQLGEPPTALVKAVNRASAQQMDDTREESGEIPRLNWLASKINRLVQSSYYFGYADVEFAWLDSAEVDALTQAQIDAINVPLEITTVTEARIRDGKAPLPQEEEMEQDGEVDEGEAGGNDTHSIKGARGKSPGKTQRAGFSASKPSRLVSFPKGRSGY
jgi:hypothetical protein